MRRQSTENAHFSMADRIAREASSKAPASPTVERLLNIRDVQGQTTLSRTTIYRQVGEGTFPSPVKIGTSRVAWRASDIAAWLGELPPAT